jgi:hypothetical protein
VVRNELAAAVIVTTIAAFAAMLLVYEVVRRWKGESVARWTIVLLLAFPTSIFLWQFYTEALLIALSAGAILAMLQRRTWLAGVLGALTAMTRPPGILIFVVLVVMAFEQRRRVREMVPLLLCPVGLAIVMIVLRQQAGDAFAFTHGSEGWGRHLSLPWGPVNATLRAYVHGGGPHLQGWSWSTLSALGSPRDLIATYLFLALFIVSVVRPWPWSARAFILAMVLMPLATGIVQSMSRYVLAAWPAFAVAADVVPARARRSALGIATVAFVVVSIGVLRDWSNGLFIA